MSTTPTYPPGTPVWVDLTSPDPTESARFYGALFGWEAEDLGERAGHYRMFRKDGKTVAGAAASQGGAPPVWSTYVATADADATAVKVSEAGGQVIMAPLDVMNDTRMAVFTDPSGAFFSVWQSANMSGAEHANAPGGFCWNELQTRDIERAKSFYGSVFGWGAKTQSTGGVDYTEWQVEGKSVAGGMSMQPNTPPDVPPHWLVYFAVDDTDAAVAKVQELGGNLMAPAMDSPAGRFALVADPHGAAFSVIKVEPM